MWGIVEPRISKDPLSRFLEHLFCEVSFFMLPCPTNSRQVSGFFNSTRVLLGLLFHVLWQRAESQGIIWYASYFSGITACTFCCPVSQDSCFSILLCFVVIYVRLIWWNYSHSRNYMILKCSLFPVFYKLVMIFIDQLLLVDKQVLKWTCQEKYSI